MDLHQFNVSTPRSSDILHLAQRTDRLTIRPCTDRTWREAAALTAVRYGSDHSKMSLASGGACRRDHLLQPGQEPRRPPDRARARRARLTPAVFSDDRRTSARPQLFSARPREKPDGAS